MKSTTDISKSSRVESLLHLATPSSQSKPLCEEASPDAAIGSYSEHLDDKGEWCREVFGKDGKPGKACADCLARYPSILHRKSLNNEDGWPFFLMLAKWHIGAIAVPLLIWLFWVICKWLAEAPYPPRIP